MIVLGVFLLILFVLWIVSVELRLKAAELMGEIVVDDFERRGLISKEMADTVRKKK